MDFFLAASALMLGPVVDCVGSAMACVALSSRIEGLGEVGISLDVTAESLHHANLIGNRLLAVCPLLTFAVDSNVVK